LIKEGKIEVLHEDWALDWKPENAKKIMNAAITKAGTNIDAVIAGNDGTAGGAIQALIEEGVAGKVMVIGQDAELTACQRIVRGTQSMTIYKPIKDLAKRAAQIAVDIAKKNPPTVTEHLNNGFKKVPTILEKVIAVDKDNLTQTVVADGFHKAEDLK
ncbi:MAG: D-xylose transporter subunit XylF, partial [Verrucomicrobiaceae bacterium]